MTTQGSKLAKNHFLGGLGPRVRARAGPRLLFVPETFWRLERLSGEYFREYTDFFLLISTFLDHF